MSTISSVSLHSLQTKGNARVGRLFDTLKHTVKLARIGYTARTLRNSKKPQERARAQRALVTLLSDVKGIPMKVGQLFATSDEKDVFQELVTSIEPLPLEKVLPLLQHALPQEIAEAVLDTIEPSRAAASLGQVHFAELSDGTPLAIKVQYPGIRDAVESELKLLGWMPQAGPVKKWGFNLDAYKQELRDNMERELDYTIEAQSQLEFRQALHGVPGLSIPNVYTEYSNASILVQEREQGVWLADARQWSKKERLHIARTLLMTLFRSIFVLGKVHADPHEGNTLYRHDSMGHPVVVMLDFGCTLEVSSQARLALLKLLIATQEGLDVSPLQCFAAMGFEPSKLVYIYESLPQLTRILFRPFLESKAFDVKTWNLGSSIQDLLGEKRWWFRSAGPAQLFLLMRAFQGTVHQLQTFDVQLPWWPFLKRALGEELLQTARTYALPELPDALLENRVSMQAIARHLRVQVLENNTSQLELTLPAEAAFELRNVIPSEVLDSITSSKTWNLDEIEKRVRDTSSAPQELFALKTKKKEYKVWLE